MAQISRKADVYEVNGRRYLIKLLSRENFYERKFEYLVTDVQVEDDLSFGDMKKDVEALMNRLHGKEIIPKVDRDRLYKETSSMEYALASYYTFKYIESEDYFLYTLIEPYDD